MTDQTIAALYLRSATSNPDSIAEQRRLCTEHAATEGWDVGPVFIDDGMSGLRDERPGLTALRDFISSAEAQVVLVTEPSRIARDAAIIDGFKGLCDANDVRLAYVDASATGPSRIMERLFQEHQECRRSKGDNLENEERCS